MSEIIIQIDCMTITIDCNCDQGYRLLEDGSYRLLEDDQKRELE